MQNKVECWWLLKLFLPVEIKKKLLRKKYLFTSKQLVITLPIISISLQFISRRSIGTKDEEDEFCRQRVYYITLMNANRTKKQSL